MKAKISRHRGSSLKKAYLAASQVTCDVHSCQPEAVGRCRQLQGCPHSLQQQRQPGLVHLQRCSGLWRYLHSAPYTLLLNFIAHCLTCIP